MADIYKFGHQLLITKDLDPVYVVLWEAKLERKLLKQWLLAYWCFYHVGTAAWITEGDYWSRMEQAAGSKDWPRSAERRHFRGENAKKSVAWLQSRGVDALFQPLIGVNATVGKVTNYVQTWVGFGPWIAFKVADMIERLGLSEVRFDDSSMFLFDSPQEGARMLWRLEKNSEGGDEAEPWAVARILSELDGSPAPPRYERGINAQEAETILCKWKSAERGHYHIGEDIEAVKNGLLKFAKCKISQRLLKGGKQGGLW